MPSHSKFQNTERLEAILPDAEVLAVTAGLEHEAWLELRKSLGTLGASTIPGVLGLNPYQGPWTEWAQLNGLLAFKGNKFTARGQRLEGFIKREAANVLGIRWVDSRSWRFSQDSAREIPAILGSSSYPGLSCNLDGAVNIGGALGSLECKFSAPGLIRWQRGERSPDEIVRADLDAILANAFHKPESKSVRYWKAQCQVQMAITGWSFSILAVMLGCEAGLDSICSGEINTKRDFRVLGFTNDPEVSEGILRKAQEWHLEHILGDKQPVPYARDLKSVREVFKEASGGKHITLDWGLDLDWMVDKLFKKDYSNEEEEEQHKAAIMLHMRDAETAKVVGTGYTVNWKNTARGRRFGISA